MIGARPVRARRGTTLTARSCSTEAPLSMLMNNLDPENAERPDDLVVYVGTGRAARSWASYDALVRTLTTRRDDETVLVQSGKPVGVFRTHEWAGVLRRRRLVWVLPGGAAMTIFVRRQEDYRRMPWANGGGVTLDVARGPHSSVATDFVWRVSVADVEADGNFSALPGVDRIIVLAEGRWMLLTVDSADHMVKPGQPLAFSGDSDVFCAVPSPTRDLNVMIRRGVATASFEVVERAAGVRVEAEGADQLILVWVRGPLRVKGSTGGMVYLVDFDAALCDPTEPVTVDGQGCVAVTRIRLTDPDLRAGNLAVAAETRFAMPSAGGR